MNRVLILVEGQTEERFIKDILQPHLWDLNVDLQPKIATTKRVKDGRDFKGGATKFKKVEDDLRRLLGDTGAARITTLLDFYGFPKDFPGWANVTATLPYDRVRQLETALQDYFANPKFRAYLMLHEFEAMLFAGPDQVAQTLNQPNKVSHVQAIVDSCTGPEKINEGVHTAPSKRVKSLFPAYQKTLHGPLIIDRIGLDQVRQSCPHFHEWVEELEGLSV
jgi:hypothetical protein